TLSYGFEIAQGAGFGEKPLAITERMRVLGSQRPHRGCPNVPDEDVGADIRSELRHVDFVAVVYGAAAHEHLVALVEADAPPQLRIAPADAQRIGLESEDAAGEIGAITNQSE